MSFYEARTREKEQDNQQQRYTINITAVLHISTNQQSKINMRHLQNIVLFPEQHTIGCRRGRRHNHPDTPAPPPLRPDLPPHPAHYSHARNPLSLDAVAALDDAKFLGHRGGGGGGTSSRACGLCAADFLLYCHCTARFRIVISCRSQSSDAGLSASIRYLSSSSESPSATWVGRESNRIF